MPFSNLPSSGGKCGFSSETATFYRFAATGDRIVAKLSRRSKFSNAGAGNRLGRGAKPVKSLEELTNTDDSAIDLIRQWTALNENHIEILPPSANREAVLLDVQVTTHSTMGAVAYETGGVLVDDGWLRFLGSGHPRLTRTLPGWNQDRSNGFYLIGDDAAGGFFALNGGAFGDDRGNVYYWAPDRLEWEGLGLGYTDLFRWALTDRLAEFYADLRWPTWKEDVAELPGDRCYGFFPFLWTSEGSIEGSHRATVPVHEAFDCKCDILRQLQA
jgi:hypothetical protein